MNREESLIQLTFGLAARLFSTVEPFLTSEADRDRILERFREVVASDVRRYEARNRKKSEGRD